MWVQLIAVTLVSLAIVCPASAQTVTDGDTIKLGGTTYRLWGIDAAETHQTCADGWPAGREATVYMLALVRGLTIKGLKTILLGLQRPQRSHDAGVGSQSQQAG